MMTTQTITPRGVNSSQWLPKPAHQGGWFSTKTTQNVTLRRLNSSWWLYQTVTLWGHLVTNLPPDAIVVFIIILWWALIKLFTITRGSIHHDEIQTVTPRGINSWDDHIKLSHQGGHLVTNKVADNLQPDATVVFIIIKWALIKLFTTSTTCTWTTHTCTILRLV